MLPLHCFKRIKKIYVTEYTNYRNNNERINSSLNDKISQAQSALTAHISASLLLVLSPLVLS